MDLQIATTMPASVQGVMAMSRAASHEAGLTLRPLEGPEEIGSILHLRGEIDLSVHAAAGPEFERLEKKETSSAVRSPSNSTVR